MTHFIRTYTLLFVFFSALSTASWASPVASETEPAKSEQTNNAQTQEDKQADSAAKKDSREEKVEVIRIEGNSTKIDEVRVRGETKSITVTPKHTPAYEISQKPASQSRSDKSTGRAQWRVLSF